jgi:hypothetical protein
MAAEIFFIQLISEEPQLHTVNLHGLHIVHASCDFGALILL